MTSSAEGKSGILPECSLAKSIVSGMNMSPVATEGVREGRFSDTVLVVVDTVGLIPVVQLAKSAESLSTPGCPCERERLVVSSGENTPCKDDGMGGYGLI